MWAVMRREEASIKNMEDMGVGTTHIKVAPGVNTGLAVITVGDHDNTIVVVAGANDKVDRNMWTA